MSDVTPLSEDALNRFRITHSDRDLRPLLRRLHRLPYLSKSTLPPDASEDSPAGSTTDLERETEMIKLELMKWRGGVERVMASVRNLERQKKTYLKRADQTVASTSEQRQTLQTEQELLVQTRIQRDRHIKCDEVAAKISARKRTRKELDEQIAEVQKSLEEHRSSHAQYLKATSSRIEIFSQITKLVEECRGTTLPIDTQSSVPQPEESDAMEIDDPHTQPNSASTRLSGAALPFQPSTSTSAPPTRSSTPAPESKPKAPVNLNHALPTRPSRAPSTLPASTSAMAAPTRTLSQSTRIPSSSNLPTRPTTLRSTTTPNVGSHGSLEEGEVGEDGELVESSGGKRSSNTGERTTRSVRPRGK